jgi:hypothetical protein
MTGAIRPLAVGVDAHQRRAREAAGIQLPRAAAPKVTEKLVNILVTVECGACGGTNAWPCDAKQAAKVCSFCGTPAKAHRLDAHRDFLSGGGK